MKKAQAASELLRSKTFVLVTPRAAILQGQISDDWDGFLQIHSLVQMRDSIDTIIKQWDNHREVNKQTVKKGAVNGRDKTGGPKSRRHQQSKTR